MTEKGRRQKTGRDRSASFPSMPTKSSLFHSVPQGCRPQSHVSLAFLFDRKETGNYFVGDAYHNKGLLRAEGKRRKSVNNKGFGKPDSRLLPSLRCPLKPSHLGMPVPASWRWLVAFSGMQSVRMLLFLSFVTPPFS